MKLFIAKLSPRTNGATLEAVFAKYGEVLDARVVYDRHSGDSKCYAFVEMPNEEEGRKAIESLNESTLDGNEIVVKEADDRKRKFGPRF